VVFNTGPFTVLPDNSILITANMQSDTGFPSSHQLKSYVATKSRLKLAARAVLSADAGLLVNCGYSSESQFARYSCPQTEVLGELDYTPQIGSSLMAIPKGHSLA